MYYQIFFKIFYKLYFVCNVYVVKKKIIFFLSLIFSHWPFSPNCEKKKKKEEEEKSNIILICIKIKNLFFKIFHNLYFVLCTFK